MVALVADAGAAGIWVFAENTASVSLHERAGFKVVGRRERIAQLDGVWRDTLLLELRLELYTLQTKYRRSERGEGRARAGS